MQYEIKQVGMGAWHVKHDGAVVFSVSDPIQAVKAVDWHKYIRQQRARREATGLVDLVINEQRN